MKRILLIAMALLICLSGCKKQEVKEENTAPATIEKEEVKPATVEVITPEPEETPVSENNEPVQQNSEESTPQGMTVDEDATYEVEEDSDYIIN